MKIEQLQFVVNVIREVCKKHNVALIATDSSEGIYGEITLIDLKDGCGWIDWEKRLTNIVEDTEYGDLRDRLIISGIGDVTQ